MTEKPQSTLNLEDEWHEQLTFTFLSGIYNILLHTLSCWCAPVFWMKPFWSHKAMTRRRRLIGNISQDGCYWLMPMHNLWEVKCKYLTVWPWACLEAAHILNLVQFYFFPVGFYILNCNSPIMVQKSNVSILWFQVCLKVMIFELKQSQLWTIIWSMSNKISTQTSILFNDIYSTKREPNLLRFFQTKLLPQCLQCHQILKENSSVILAPLGQMKTVKQDFFCVLISLFTLFVCLWYPLFSIAKC